jgi:phenylacetate-CoA ligase
MKNDQLNKADLLLKGISTKKSSYWKKVQEIESLNVFHRAATGVPAYKNFLKKNGIKHEKVQTWSDFQQVPFIDKKNYLSQYELKDLLWNGNFNKPLVYTSTSGSTGIPYYFTRSEELDWRCSVFMEMFMRQNFHHSKAQSTLVVVCFGMGVWIGGMITYKAFELTAIRNNFPISIITPGINKKEILNVLKELAPNYEQTIIAGYPPLVKDIIDEAILMGIKVQDLNIKVKFAAESITEEFRNYISRSLKMDNKYLNTVNVYGSAELGAMAAENATSILLKRLALKNKRLFKDIFNSIDKTPTLAQYIPSLLNFESVDGRLYITSDSALPLIRYSIGDSGGVLSYDEFSKLAHSHGINIKVEAKKLGIEEQITELPFVYVYERTDLSTTFYGLWIYPEWIKGSLLKGEVSKYLTGKFTMITRTDDKQNQILEINLELQKGKTVNSRLKKLTLKNIVTGLRAHSSEYRELALHLNGKSLPHLNFWEAEHPLYFQPGIKQKWTQKVQ